GVTAARTTSRSRGIRHQIGEELSAGGGQLKNLLEQRITHGLHSIRRVGSVQDNPRVGVTAFAFEGDGNTLALGLRLRRGLSCGSAPRPSGLLLGSNLSGFGFGLGLVGRSSSERIGLSHCSPF